MRFVAFCLFAVSYGIAQGAPDSDSPVRVCVGIPANISHLNVNPVVERDRLIDYINVRDGARAKKKVVAVPVPGGDEADTRKAARAQDCRLLVALRFEESFGYQARNQDPVSHQPPLTRGGTQMTRRVTLAYSIARVDGRAFIDEGGTPLFAGGSDEDAVSNRLSALSPRVVRDAEKSKP